MPCKGRTERDVRGIAGVFQFPSFQRAFGPRREGGTTFVVLTTLPDCGEWIKLAASTDLAQVSARHFGGRTEVKSLWRRESETDILGPMPVRSCRVTIRDLEGTDHSVQVTASTLYEAVALGLASLRGEEWVGGIGEGPNTVRVAVTNVPVEHQVAMKDFHAWLERPARSPRDVMQRARVREILGLSTQRAT